MSHLGIYYALLYQPGQSQHWVGIKNAQGECTGSSTDAPADSSANYGYIWVGSSAIGIAFIYFFVPETRNRSLEELQELFDKKLPARKFACMFCQSY